MNILYLKRNKEDPVVKGTVGRLYTKLGNDFLDSGLSTLELPWNDNQIKISCIPTGRFSMWWGHSPRFGDNRWHIEVPGRTGILFHRGICLAHTTGCILVGSGVSTREGKWPEFLLEGSGPAYPLFVKLLGDGVRAWELEVSQNDF